MYTRLAIRLTLLADYDISTVQDLLSDIRELCRPNEDPAPILEIDGLQLTIGCDVRLTEDLDDIRSILNTLRPHAQLGDDLVGYYRREDVDRPTMIWAVDNRFVFEGPSQEDKMRCNAFYP